MKNRYIKSGLLCALAALLLLSAVGCKKRTGNAELLAVTVNDARVYLDEAMYYIWKMEKESAPYERLYREKEEGDFWEQDAGDGQTVQSAVKQDVMDSIVRTEILYAKAKEEGYSLSEDDMEQCRRRAGEWLDGLTEGQIKITQLNEKLLFLIAQKDLLVSRYFNDVTEAFDISREELEASMSPEDYRELSMEKLSIPKDERGALEQMRAALKEAEEVKSLGMLVEDDKSPLEYEEYVITVGQDTCDPEEEKEALKLAEGETSGILETGESYCILRMVESQSEEGYEEAVEDALENEKFRTFDEFYGALLKESTVTVNQEVWDTIQIGKTTIKE